VVQEPIFLSSLAELRPGRHTINHSLTKNHGFALIFQQLRQNSQRIWNPGKHGGRLDAERRTMSRRPTKFGFAVPARDEYAPEHGSTLPALIATVSLGLSIAVVLTAMTVTARAAHLF